MKIEIQKETQNELKFVLTDATTAFANLLRRYAITRVPTFAIEDVTIYENNSSFFDEYIAHRLGLIPLTTPRKVSKSEEVTLTLDVSEPGIVYSSSLKSSDKNVKPVSQKIPIIKLNDGQSVRIECKAILGEGKDHAKWQPGIVSYGYEKEGEYNFTIESYGQMPAKEILAIALEKIQENSEEIAKQLEKLKKE